MAQEAPLDPFPTRLRTARELRGESQAALAQATGLPATSISHFEGGTRKPSFDNLKRLADHLRVSADYLLGRTESVEGVAASDVLARHASKLTTADRELMEGFMELLIQKDMKKRDT